MSRSVFDLIVAPITAIPGPVALVRISGDEAWTIGHQLFSPWPKEPLPNLVRYGTLCHGDDGLLTLFAAGSSFTGEESLELSMHGSRASVSTFLERCYELGIRCAEPGEFSQRAFLNGRIDLTQVEAIRDCIEASSALHLKLATRNREGALSAQIRSIRDDAFKVLSLIDVTVDFSEEIGDLDRASVVANLQGLIGRVEDLAKQALPSRYVRKGMHIALIGQPNAGKSSLFNALLGRDRAIVTEIAGTTRDTIEESSEIAGVPIILIDTAGLRDSADSIETLGIERTRAAVAVADAALLLYDSTQGWQEIDQAILESSKIPTLVLATKADLQGSNDDHPTISAHNRTGFEQIENWVAQLADIASLEVLITPDQETTLLKTNQALEQARAVLSQDLPFDLASVCLQEATYLLGQITGETAEEDMLDRMFRDFCVGK